MEKIDKAIKEIFKQNTSLLNEIEVKDLISFFKKELKESKPIIQGLELSKFNQFVCGHRDSEEFFMTFHKYFKDYLNQ